MNVSFYFYEKIVKIGVTGSRVVTEQCFPEFISAEDRIIHPLDYRLCAGEHGSLIKI